MQIVFIHLENEKCLSHGNCWQYVHAPPDHGNGSGGEGSYLCCTVVFARQRMRLTSFCTSDFEVIGIIVAHQTDCCSMQLQFSSMQTTQDTLELSSVKL